MGKHHDVKTLIDLKKCSDAARICVAENIVSACFENAIPSSLSEPRSVIRDAFAKLSNRVNIRKFVLANGKIESDEDAQRLSQFTSAIASRIVLRFVLGVLKLRSRLRVQVWKKFKLKQNQIGTEECDVDIERVPFTSDVVSVKEFCDLMWSFGFRREYDDATHEDSRDEILLRRVREAIRKDRDGDAPLHYKTMKRELIETFGEDVFSRCKIKIGQELSSATSEVPSTASRLKHRRSSAVAESGDEGLICPKCRRTFDSVMSVTAHFEQCVKIEERRSIPTKNYEWFSNKNDFKSWIHTQSCCHDGTVNVTDFVREWKNDKHSSMSAWSSLSYFSSHLRHQFVLLLFRTLNDLSSSKISSLWEEYMEPVMRDLRQVMYILNTRVDALDLEVILRRRRGCHESALFVVNELLELREDVSATQKNELLESIRPFCEDDPEHVPFEMCVKRHLDVFTQTSFSVAALKRKRSGLSSPSNRKRLSACASLGMLKDEKLEKLLIDASRSVS